MNRSGISMIEAIRKNKLFIVVLGLMLIASIIILILIFSNKNSAKVPLRGVFVNGADSLQYLKEGVSI